MGMSASASDKSPETLVLLNPHAASGRAAQLRAPLQHALRGTAARMVVTDTVASAEAALRDLPPGARAVVAGGDGTLQHLLPTVLSQRLELALLPCGTGNDTARSFGLHGLPWTEALAQALAAPAWPTDVGEAAHAHGTTPFISSLCVGFDAAVCERALQSPRWLRGKPRYLWATLAEIAALQPRQVRVLVDGRLSFEGPALFVSTLNTPTYGSGMPACPAARLDDGHLNHLLAGQFGRLGALAMMPLLLCGQHLRHRRVRTGPCDTVQIESAAPLPLAADGEPLLASKHITVRVRPGALLAVRLRALAP